MSEATSTATSTPLPSPPHAPNQPTPRDRLRLRQRKKRKTTSCWPCRERKVKCDRCSPCDTCIKRGHADICSFERQLNAQSQSHSQSHSHSGIPSPVPAAVLSPLHPPLVPDPDEDVDVAAMVRSFRNGHSRSRQPALTEDPVSTAQRLLNRRLTASSPSADVVSDGRDTQPPFLGEDAIPSLVGHQNMQPRASSANTDVGDTQPPFLGENAIPSFVRDQTSAEDTDMDTATATRRTNVEVGIMPILGLEHGDTLYPFEPIVVQRERVHDALPSDREIFKLFQSFRTQLQCFTPILSDIDEFEQQVCRFIDYRSKHNGNTNLTESFSFSWLGLLYAVLASGVQFSDSSNESRSKISQKYLQYAFQSLRFANFLMRPTKDCLQAFLVLGNVLQNAMKPEAAWILLGTTARIAQSLGLHATKKTSPAGKKLWLAVVWQDSLLSLCFDRPLATMPQLTISPCTNPTSTSRMTYYEAMYSLLDCTMRGVRAKSTCESQLEAISCIVDELEQIFDKSQEHLKSSENCVSFQQRCEHYALHLHVSFVAGWLCRGAFKRAPVQISELEVKTRLTAKGKQHLVASLRAYLSLQPLCVQASRSWAFIHNGLSSALLLGLLGETKTNPEVRQLQGALIDALSTTSDETNSHFDTQSSVILSKLHERALLALKNLYNDQVQIVGEIPDVGEEAIDLSAGMNGNGNRQVPNAESIAQLSEWENSRPPDGMALTLPDDMEMSPMEMFDSIIWDPTFGSEGFSGMDMNTEQWMF